MKPLKIASTVFTIILLCVLVFLPTHRVDAVHQHAFSLDAPFLDVRKIILRTDAKDVLVDSQHGEIIDEEWDSFVLSSAKLFGIWSFKGSGTFTLKPDPLIGSAPLVFNQKVFVGTELITSTAELAAAVGALKKCDTQIRIEASGDKTNVLVVTSISYRRRIPSIYKSYMKNQIDDLMKQSASNYELAFKSLVKQYVGKTLILPLNLEQKTLFD